MTHLDPEKDKDTIDEIGNRFADYYKSPMYPISRREVLALGLPARDATDGEADAMWDLYLAYRALKLQGKAQLGGKDADVSRLGHIDSGAGTTLGVQLIVPSDGQGGLGVGIPLANLDEAYSRGWNGSTVLGARRTTTPATVEECSCSR